MKITLLGNPYSTNNIYYHKGHRVFIKPKPRKQKDDWSLEAKSQWNKEALDCELKIKVGLFFGDKRKRDFDNYHKLCIDSLTNIVWKDDSQIQEAIIKKFYDKENPRIEIEIEKLDNAKP